MPKLIVYNGIEMVEGWPERIEEAQKLLEYSIGGVRYARVPYGAENDEWNADDGPCHDCSVVKGQLHVSSCDVEQCPACGGQAIGCDCEHDDDE